MKVIYVGEEHDPKGGQDVSLDNLSDCRGFEWDEGNTDKNRIKHGVSRSECEQIFFNVPVVVGDDAKHSHAEIRYFALGRTDTGRGLLVVFTVRGDSIRVISARDMNRKERRIYDEKENPEIRE